MGNFFIPELSKAGTTASEPIPQVYPDQEVVDAAFDHYRETGFPYRHWPKHVCLQEINELAATKTDELVHSKAAFFVADTYHRHRFHARVNGSCASPHDVWESDRHLRIALEKQLKHVGRIPSGYFTTIHYANGAQACCNFRPAYALFMYRKFLPPGGITLDTSTGYGGRLVGFMASQGRHYIGIDPNVPTHKANRKMASDLMPKGKTYHLINSPAEDVRIGSEGFEGVCDFAFTSPPYFAKELYSEDDTQSWVRYKTGKDWCKGFLLPMMKLQFAALKAGCVSAVNIADVKLKGRTYPLVKWTIRAAKLAGFEQELSMHFPVTTHRWGSKKEDHPDSVANEPVLIFRKPKG